MYKRKEMDMYKEKLAVAIKHNGKILREKQDLVQLPFGSEFSVLVKNLNSRRAKFTLHIDGTDVLSGEEIIVNANSEIEMKRFIKNGNMNEGNAFKFIERTASIEDGPRGIKIDDGVVRVEFWFEQEAPEVKTTIHNDIYYDKYYPWGRRDWYGGSPWYDRYGTFGSTSGSILDGSNAISSNAASIANDEIKMQSVVRSANATSASYSSSASFGATAGGTAEETLGQIFSKEINDAGITVPGSKVEQKFTPVYGFRSETQSHVIVIRLAGKVGETEVITPVTVKSKPKCETCGKVNKATSKFCAECGTHLEII